LFVCVRIPLCVILTHFSFNRLQDEAPKEDTKEEKKKKNEKEKEEALCSFVFISFDVVSSDEVLLSSPFPHFNRLQDEAPKEEKKEEKKRKKKK